MIMKYYKLPIVGLLRSPFDQFIFAKSNGTELWIYNSTVWHLQIGLSSISKFLTHNNAEEISVEDVLLELI